MRGFSGSHAPHPLPTRGTPPEAVARLNADGSLDAAFNPNVTDGTVYSILPQALHPSELITGNAWVEAATFLAILLGTIVGLIHGFTAVSGVNPAQKQDQLSAAVAIAMNCTAFGLITAIPLLLIHAWLVTKTDEMIDSLEIASVKFLNSLGLKK